MFKLLDYNVIPAVCRWRSSCRASSRWLIGYICLRRSGIYFSILTLAFAQMTFALAYSVLTPHDQWRNRPAGLSKRHADACCGATEPTSPHFFGIVMRDNFWQPNIGGWQFTFNDGYYFCAIIAILAFYLEPAHLPLALRDDAARDQVEPAADELYRPQLTPLHAGRFRDLGHVCRSGRWPSGRRWTRLRVPSGCSGPPRARSC